jgi:hypothetical protein
MDAEERLKSLYQAFKRRGHRGDAGRHEPRRRLVRWPANRTRARDKGDVIVDTEVVHLYEVRGGLVARMDIEEAG